MLFVTNWLRNSGKMKGYPDDIWAVRIWTVKFPGDIWTVEIWTVKTGLRLPLGLGFLLGLDLGLGLVLGFELAFRLGLGLGLVMTVQFMTVQILTVQFKTGNHGTVSSPHSPSDYLSLRTWMTSSARVRGLCTPSAYCGPTVWRRQLCSRCSVRSSSLSPLTPLRRGGALRSPSTDSVSMLFCVELLGLTCGHRLGNLTRIRSRTSATQLMMNCSKSELPPTTFYMHSCHHYPQHYRTTVLDSVLYTHFSYLNAQHISLTVIS